jgi:hypothetical protein
MVHELAASIDSWNLTTSPTSLASSRSSVMRKAQNDGQERCELLCRSARAERSDVYGDYPIPPKCIDRYPPPLCQECRAYRRFAHGLSGDSAVETE